MRVDISLSLRRYGEGIKNNQLSKKMRVGKPEAQYKLEAQALSLSWWLKWSKAFNVSFYNYGALHLQIFLQLPLFSLWSEENIVPMHSCLLSNLACYVCIIALIVFSTNTVPLGSSPCSLNTSIHSTSLKVKGKKSSFALSSLTWRSYLLLIISIKFV